MQRQVELETHTCFHVTGNEPYIELAERLNALTPGGFEKRTYVRELRRRGRRERREDRAQEHRSSGDRHVRPRLPRAHPPRDVADREGHALQAGHGTVRARDLPAPLSPTRTAGRADRSTVRRRRSPTRSTRCTSTSARRTSPGSSSSRSRARAASSSRPPGSSRGSPTSVR